MNCKPELDKSVMLAVDKDTLLQWIYEETGTALDDFGGLSDGSVLHQVPSGLPCTGQHTELPDTGLPALEIVQCLHRRLLMP